MALALARERAARCDGEIEFAAADVLADPLPSGFQIVTCSLFLHHLSAADVVALLSKMAAASAGMLVVNDLNRSLGGYLLAHVACQLLTRSRVVHADGPASIAAAFTLAEAGDLCRQAGIENAMIRRRWPSRLMITWNRDAR